MAIGAFTAMLFFIYKGQSLRLSSSRKERNERQRWINNEQETNINIYTQRKRGENETKKNTANEHTLTQFNVDILYNRKTFFHIENFIIIILRKYFLRQIKIITIMALLLLSSLRSTTISFGFFSFLRSFVFFPFSVKHSFIIIMASISSPFKCWTRFTTPHSHKRCPSHSGFGVYRSMKIQVYSYADLCLIPGTATRTPSGKKIH